MTNQLHITGKFHLETADLPISNHRGIANLFSKDFRYKLFSKDFQRVVAPAKSSLAAGVPKE